MPFCQGKAYGTVYRSTVRQPAARQAHRPGAVNKAAWLSAKVFVYTCGGYLSQQLSGSTRSMSRQPQLSVSKLSGDTGDESSVGNAAYMTCLWSANQLGLAYFDQTTGCVRVCDKISDCSQQVHCSLFCCSAGERHANP